MIFCRVCNASNIPSIARVRTKITNFIYDDIHISGCLCIC